MNYKTKKKKKREERERKVENHMNCQSRQFLLDHKAAVLGCRRHVLRANSGQNVNTSATSARWLELEFIQREHYSQPNVARALLSNMWPALRPSWCRQNFSPTASCPSGVAPACCIRRLPNRFIRQAIVCLHSIHLDDTVETTVITK